MKKPVAIILLVSISVFILNCQNAPNSSTSQPTTSPTASPAAQELKWSEELKGLFTKKCEEGLNEDKSTSETIDVKGACTCSTDEIVKRFPEGAQRFTSNVSNEDQKTLEEIGKECALKNIKQN